MTELLIVLAILGIVATLAYPAYLEVLRKQRRLDAMNGLLQVQAAQQRHHGRHGTYATTLTALGWAAEAAPSPAGHYLLRLEDSAAGRFVAVAVPRPGGSQVDDACQRFVLDQDGPAPARSSDPGCWLR